MLHIRYLNIIPLCSPQSSTGTFSWAHSPGTRSGVQAPWFWHVPQMQVACWHEYPPAVWNSQICHGALFFLFAITCCVIIKTLLLFIISVIIVLWTYEWNIYWQRRRFNIPRCLICQKRLGFSKKNLLIHVSGTQEGYLKYKSRHFCKLLKKCTNKNIDFGMQMA